MKKPRVFITQLAGEVGTVEVTAETLGERFNLTAEAVTEKTGVTKLCRFGPGETLLSVSLRVAKRLLAGYPYQQEIQQNLKGVFATSNCTLETIMPGYAAQVAAGLGLTHVIADQVGMGCGGSLQALRAAHDRLVVDSLEGRTANYLVMAGDATSLILDELDYMTGLLFSEGVAGLIVTNDVRLATQCYEIVEIGTKSFLGPDLRSLTIGNPYSSGTRGELSGFKMSGGDVFRFGTEMIPHFLELVRRERVEKNWAIFPHQPNLRMLLAMAESAGVDPKQIYMEGIKRIGNTSPPAVLLGLEDGLRSSMFPEGSPVLLGAFGAELTVGAALLMPRGFPHLILC